jgi:Condensin II non structural maintenance of chromosomes subunit
MEAQADALLSSLQAAPPGAPPLLAAAALPDLSATLSVLPRKRHAALAAAVLDNVLNLKPTSEDDPAKRAAAGIINICLRDKKSPTPPDLLAAATALVSSLEQIEAPVARNAVIKVAEGFWEDGRAGREVLAPFACTALIERSLAAEAGGTSSAEDVRRVYAMRDLLTESHDTLACHHPRLRPLLLRCVTSAMYLKVPEGQKLIARVFFETEMSSAVHAALLSMLPVVRKSRAVAIGSVYVQAWKVFGTAGEDRFADILQDILTKAVRAATDPLATNLRTVLSAFHTNKKLSGMDGTLHAVYTPILFRALTAANPLVRRNASIILADSFPIHNPTMSNAELESILDEQCAKLYMLLEDPVPLVRVSAVEGACRVLGLLWELVPPAFTKKMLHVMTADLAFDTVSAHTRAAVCDGLRFMLENHMTHPLMSVALPRLANMLHDRSERVRLSFLHLLLTLKEKRIISARYFDVVPIEEFLLRLSSDTPAVTSKIMKLLVTSYFPLQRKNKTRDEIAASQVRACLDMVKQNPASASAFYGHLSMYIPPGPLVEFCISVASLAFGRADALEAKDAQGRDKTASTPPRGPRKGARRPLREANIQENVGSPRRESSKAKSNKEGKERLLAIVALVLQSIAPSLVKAANAELKATVVDIFGGASLQALTLPRGNSITMRVVALKLAASLPAKDVTPIVAEWKKQFEGLVEDCHGDSEASSLTWIIQALQAGLAWGELEFLCRTLSSWADMAFPGGRAVSLNAKTTKRARRTDSRDVSSDPDTLRRGILRALTTCASALVEDSGLRQLLISMSEKDDQRGDKQSERKAEACLQIVRSICRGAMTAVDVALEGDDDGLCNASYDGCLLHCLSAAMRLSLCVSAPAAGCENADAELAVGSQFDMLEIIQWVSGRQTLEAAFTRSHNFGTALVTVVMTHAADAAALGKLPLSVGARYLAQLAANVKSQALPEYSPSEKALTEACLRFALGAFTASYHLAENVFANAPPATSRSDGDSIPSPGPAVHLEDVQGLLEAAADILGHCPVSGHESADDAMAIRFSELMLTFLCSSESEIMAGVLKETGYQLVAKILANPLSNTLAKFGDAKKSDVPQSALLMMFTMTVVRLARKQPRGTPEMCARHLLDATLVALKGEPVHSRARLLRALANAILDSYPDTVIVTAAVNSVCTLLQTHLSDLDGFDDLSGLAESLADLKVESDDTQSDGILTLKL